MIPRTSVPRLREEAPNYAILDLNGEYSAVHASWRNCLKDFRHWCYNNSQNRFDYGGIDRRSCEAPGSGHFCIYTTYDEKWMCSVVDGATLYMHGHITRSVGRLRVCESRQPDGTTHYIEGSVYMEWDGSYIKEPLPTGAGALISSFSSLYKCAEGEKVPVKVLQRAGQVYFLHFPEAGRFDSLSLDIIDKDFVAGGTAQITDIERHQNWSSDCKVIREEIGKPTPQTDKEIRKRAEVQQLIKDIRVMHKLGMEDHAFKLQNMPFQLDENGRVQDPMQIGEVERGDGGGDGGRGAGRGGRGRGGREQGRGKRRGPQRQNAGQQNTDDTNPDFLTERFGNFAKITTFHLEVSDALNSQIYDPVLTSDPVWGFRSLLLQKSCRIRSTPTQLNAKGVTTDENQKLIETLGAEIHTAFRTEETLQASPTPHDVMHAGMSHFHSTLGKGVPKFLNRAATAPKKRVPYIQFFQLPYLMGGYHDGNHRVAPKVTRGVCLAGVLDEKLCFTQIKDLMFEVQLCTWRCIDEWSAEDDQNHSTRKGTAEHFIELWTQETSAKQTMCPEEINGKMACRGSYLSTELTAGLLAHPLVSEA